MKQIKREMIEARKRAFTCLARYKFFMFGYWAGVWVYLNGLNKRKQANPFKCLVDAARKEIEHDAKKHQPTDQG